MYFEPNFSLSFCYFFFAVLICKGERTVHFLKRGAKVERFIFTSKSFLLFSLFFFCFPFQPCKELYHFINGFLSSSLFLSIRFSQAGCKDRSVLFPTKSNSKLFSLPSLKLNTIAGFSRNIFFHSSSFFEISFRIFHLY